MKICYIRGLLHSISHCTYEMVCGLKGKVYLNPASLFIPKILAYGHSFLVLDIIKLSLILSRVSSGLECMGWSRSI